MQTFTRLPRKAASAASGLFYRRSITLFAIIGLMIIAALGTVSPPPAVAQPALGELHEETWTFVYELHADGSLEEPNDRGVVGFHTYALEALLHIRVTPTESTGPWPAAITITPTRSRGFSDANIDVGTSYTFETTMRPNCTLDSFNDRGLLEQTGYELSDLLIGWHLPFDLHATTANVVSKPYMAYTSIGGRSLPILLDGTFTIEGTSDFRARVMEKVSARFRGTASENVDGYRMSIQQIGAGQFYVHPDTEYVDISSISWVKTIDRSAGFAADRVRSKYNLTVALEFVDVQIITPRPDIDEPTDVLDVTPVDEAEHTAAEAETTDEAIDRATDEDSVHDRVIPSVDDTKPTDEPVTEPERPDTETVEETPSVDVTEQPTLIDDIEQPTLTDEEEDGEREDASAEKAEEEEKEVPTPPAEPITPLPFTYDDPANRFHVALEERFEHRPIQLSVSGTEIGGSRPGEFIRIAVRALPSPEADAGAIQQAALQAYAATLPDFVLLSEPEPIMLDGGAAYRANYHYVNTDGESVIAWALFARRGDRAFSIEYAPGYGSSHLGREGINNLQRGFRFGSAPRGHVDADVLAGSLNRYDDPDGRFHLPVPAYWPLTERTPGGNSTTFTEIGDKGYVTIFVESGATGLSVDMILQSWMNESKDEPGFAVVEPLQTTVSDTEETGHFTYTWTGSGGIDWVGTVQATIIGDDLYAVILGYESAGYNERQPVFSRMLQEFNATGHHAVETSSNVVSEDEIPRPDAQETPERTVDKPSSTDDMSFADPTNDHSVLLIGRIHTEFVNQVGNFVNEWGRNLRVTVQRGGAQWTAMTDDDGYLFLANLPALSPGEYYTITRLEGEMLGFTEPVEVSFTDLNVGTENARIALLRTVSMTLHPDNRLTVEIVPGESLSTNGTSEVDAFKARYPNSRWIPFLQGM